MFYALMFVSIFFASSNNIVLHRFDNKGLRGTGDVLLFNSAVSVVWSLIFILKNIYDGALFALSDVFWGMLYGAVISVFLLSKMQALVNGPIAITSFIGCSSLLVSTAIGILFWKEKITVIQGFGVALLLGALAVTISPKAEKAKKSWKYWCLIFFLCSSATGIIYKLHQSSASKESVDQMMLVASISSAVLLGGISLICSSIQEKTKPQLPNSALPYVLLAGILSCLYNRLNIVLSGELPSILFFPTFNGSVILISTLSGALLFREKLKTQQIVGIVMGVAALVLASGLIG